MGVERGVEFGEITTTTVSWQEKHGAVVACACPAGHHFVARVEHLKSGRGKCRKCEAKARRRVENGGGKRW